MAVLLDAGTFTERMLLDNGSIAFFVADLGRDTHEPVGWYADAANEAYERKPTRWVMDHAPDLAAQVIGAVEELLCEAHRRWQEARDQFLLTASTRQRAEMRRYWGIIERLAQELVEADEPVDDSDAARTRLVVDRASATQEPPVRLAPPAPASEPRIAAVGDDEPLLAA